MKKGFTLIELLVVVLIIGILAAIALPQYEKAVSKARGTEAMTSAKALSDALNVYYLAARKYTSNIKELDIRVEVGSASGEGLKHFTVDFSSCQNASTCTISYTPRDASAAILTYTLARGKTTGIQCSGAQCADYFSCGTVVECE